MVDRKPNFFVVGPPKAGTTSLYNYLIQHPDIFMPARKEPYFFGGWQKTSAEDLQWYLHLFSGIQEEKAAGEASTTYLYTRGAAEEIKEFKPDAKIIIILRNPVDRAYSQYWHNVRVGCVDVSFEEELEEEKRRLREGWRGFRPGLVPPAYYVKSGRYSEHVEHFIKTLGREQVRVYLFEDLVGDPEGVCRNIFEFLDVDPNCRISTGKVYNPGGSLRSPMLYKLLCLLLVKDKVKQAIPWILLKRLRMAKEWVMQKNVKTVSDMKPKTRNYLRQVFRDDILYAELLTGRDLSHWQGK